MQTLIIATRNRHKTQEIGQILGSGWNVRDLSGLAHAPIIEETGNTFEENASLKALTIARLVTGLVLADDSGLEVDALNGEPGVHSARYAGPYASDADNRHKLLLAFGKQAGDRFPARFRCVMVLASNHEILASFAGVVEGVVIRAERGHGGFGYDPMFIPAGYDQTFGELAPEIKNSLSHRARALAQVLAFLRS
jgi:XTP/dITP diphosphohydrolase